MSSVENKRVKSYIHVQGQTKKAFLNIAKYFLILPQPWNYASYIVFLFKGGVISESIFNFGSILTEMY